MRIIYSVGPYTTSSVTVQRTASSVTSASRCFCGCKKALVEGCTDAKVVINVSLVEADVDHVAGPNGIIPNRCGCKHPCGVVPRTTLSLWESPFQTVGGSEEYVKGYP